MPDEFNLQALAIFVVVLALLICWNQFGWLKAGQVLGLMSSPPERLVNIARNVAGKMDVSFNELFLMRSSLAQAYALPSRKALLFSSRLLDLLTDEEINSVCAHELAHLTESRGDYYKRYVTWIMFLPWTLVKPVIHTFGDAGFMMLLVTTFVAPIIFRHVSHKLEMRADTIAHTNESNPGAYARALAKIYEDNLVPAVNAKDRATHPHLYDRLLAAGVTPDFPRPRPTSAMSLHGRILALALGALGALLIIRIINDQRSN
jgi:Zn-dependent protease with chaperone function